MLRSFVLIYTLALFQQVFSTSTVIRGLRKNICFKHTAETNQELIFSYIISGANEKSVSARILDPKNKVLFQSSSNSREGKLVHNSTSEGKYKLCFDSLDKTGKTITFDIITTTELVFQDTAKKSEINSIRSQLRLLDIHLNMVYQNLEFSDKRSMVYSQIISETEQKLLTHSFIKLLVFVLMTVFSVLSLTSFISNPKLAKV